MTPRQALVCRYALLSGAALGLGLSPVASPPASDVLMVAVALLVARIAGLPACPFIGGVAVAATLVGLAAGTARLEDIDARALALEPGTEIHVRGPVLTTPRVLAGGVMFVVDTPAGRVAVEPAGTLPSGIDLGQIVAVQGDVRDASEWERRHLLRHGARSVLVANRIRATAVSRGGLAGVFDGIRRRAEAALAKGTPEASAALLRGFVLGQDEEITEPVREDFRRSGLAHILAVSGQNVMLLALLAAPILALIGVPLRSRLIAIAIVVAIYVPVAGAGASIQRAGVMGIAGLVAGLASRPRDRWYAICLAAAVTLAIDPRATGDVGWQLSFAAVAGILVLAAPLARVFAGRDPVPPARRLIAEAAAMTLAATLSTAPLVAHHFEVVSLTAIPANVLALPAIAPAMWLGMLAGALGQVPGAPVEPLSALGGLCAGYIGWTADLLGGEWAQVELASPGHLMTALATVVLVGGARLGCQARERRRGLTGLEGPSRLRSRVAIAVAGLAVTGLLAGSLVSRDRTSSPAALTLRILDVGQGDAILLQPKHSDPVLIDTGPPGAGVAARLDDLGVRRLAALAITHDDLDHSGAIDEVLGAVRVDRLLVAAGSDVGDCAALSCPPTTELSHGLSVQAGRLRMLVLWPDASTPPGAEPNARSLVLKATVGTFDALLTGDAEREAAPFQAGPVEVLKVAHHGSADAGLPALLATTAPELALVSAGEDNSYGHPAAETLEDLENASVPVLRTDEAGEIVIEVRGNGWSVG